MGETEIGGTRHVSRQPHLGVHFKSHNNTGWAISLMEDISDQLASLIFHLKNDSSEDRIAYEMNFFQALCDDFDVA